MSRRSSSKELSLLDAMEEIAEEQEASTANGDEDEDEDDDFDDEEEEEDVDGVKYDTGTSADDEIDDNDEMILLGDDSEVSLDRRAHVYDDSLGNLSADHDGNLYIPETPPATYRPTVDITTLGSLDPLYEDDSMQPPQNRVEMERNLEDMSHLDGDDSSRNFQLSSTGVPSPRGSISVDGGASLGDDSQLQPRQRRSFASFHSAGSTGETELSVHSAPNQRQDASVEDARRHQQRRVTITVPKDSTIGSDASSGGFPPSPRRRQNLYRSGILASPVASFSAVSALTDEGGSSAGSGFRFSRRTVFGSNRGSSGRRSGRRSAAGSSSSDSNTGSFAGPRLPNIAAAVDRLGSHEQNSAWENAAAAAAVVAATSQAPSKHKQLVQFGQDDQVLVMLNLLNITNRTDDKSQFTIEPVNAHGFPMGKGKTDEERRGPYSYVLCVVQEVHFDEDERYYTVRRYDSGSEQRADPGWMEPISGYDAIEAAIQAAKRTEQSAKEFPGEDVDGHERASWLSDILAWPLRFTRNKVIPCYRRSRAATKLLVANFLTGEPGYALRVRVTLINLFVLCSFVYLLIEPFTIAFLPASLDYPSVILEL